MVNDRTTRTMHKPGGMIHHQLPAYVAPVSATAADIRTQIIEERRREFFVEGHRLGDMRRYGIAFTPTAATAYQYGGVYGAQTCFPLPDVERINNPAIAGATP